MIIKSKNSNMSHCVNKMKNEQLSIENNLTEEQAEILSTPAYKDK